MMDMFLATRPLIPEASPEEGSMVLSSGSQVGTSVRIHQGTFLLGGPPSVPRINYLKSQVVLDLVSKQQFLRVSLMALFPGIAWHSRPTSAVHAEA